MDIRESVPGADLGPRPYQTLRTQMITVMLVFGLLPLVAMGVAGIVANLQEIEARTRNVLEAMVKNRRATVDLFLEEKHRQLELVAKAKTAEELSQDTVLEALLEEMRRDKGGIVDLGFIGPDGRHLAYVGPYALKDKDYSHEPWFREVLVRGRYESDVFLGFRKFPHMVVAVRKREAGRDYVLRATIDTDLLSALVREGGVESGADVFILNRAGEYQTQYSSEHRLMEKADIGPLPLHSGVRVVEVRRGTKTLFLATTWLHNDAWVLVARQEVPGVADLMAAHPELLVLFGLGLVLVPIFAVVIARLRLRQVRALEARHSALLESVAHAQKMAAIGRLAAGIAHEINNPLAVIQAQVGVLKDLVEDHPELPARDEFRERLAKIDAQVERGRKVTHRLLGFSRRVGPDLQPVDVAAALDETVGFVEKELEACRISIVREYDRGTPLIRASLSQLQQVFLNLINNAVDAIGKDGEIRLVVRPEGGGVEVRVQDNGRGIPAKDLPRIFDPFFSTKGGEKPHSGLGLALCADIMRSMGGRIAVESREGQGTTFILWFPLEPLEA